ncbi:MAG TPA: asparagine synthase-related protein [Gemmatimonadaceae bacterium]|nr:asparagine synthase-related protein [Gemmatimonadaceae bacterium]
MSFFACVVNVEGGAVPPSYRSAIEASSFRRSMSLEWCSMAGFVGAVGVRDGVPTASVVLDDGAVAIGDVRLDNRVELVRRCAGSPPPRSDLELALRLVLRNDGASAGRMLGDFAFVTWDPSRRSLLGVRDSFGVRKLFHSTEGALWFFASHASTLAREERYDLEYLVDRLAQCRSDPDRTVFAGVSAVPPASVLHVHGGRSAITTYWTAARAQAALSGIPSPDDACAQFRELLVESVRLRASQDVPVWSHLSGGLDSSSVVSIAQWLAGRGRLPAPLAGTITYTDSLGTSADEREYSDAVSTQLGLRNELVPHHVEAPEHGADLPLRDQPNYPMSMALRDQAAARVVYDAGGRVLLTGEGGDSLVAGTMFFFADWLVTGRGIEAVREMAHRAALGRVSFWRLAYENAVLPLMPPGVRRLLTRTRIGSTPPWIPARLARRQGLAARSTHDRIYDGRAGRKYADAVRYTIGSISAGLPLGPRNELIDVRHPYLHRPLVELALGLTPELCVRPHERKWILREAMRGILPEKVRTRIGKGTLDGLNVRSLMRDTKRTDILLDNSILADLGCLEVGALRQVLDDIRRGVRDHAGWRDKLGAALDVEMWLRLRSGRWAAMDTQSRAQVRNVADLPAPSTGQLSRSIT